LLIKKRSISGVIGKGDLYHNNRRFVAENVDRSRIANNITIISEDVKSVYHELFDESLAEDARQFDESLALQSGGSGRIENGEETDEEIINKIPENGFGWPGQAYEFLEKYGIDRGDAGVLTQYDWAMEKQKGNTGKAFQYSTYREYLTAWVTWMIVNS
jgi:hypothetical protein